ncbi:MAG: single-stranded-DNA-specific exonuclease RecJ [Patescibacteria group bacterium]
MSHQELPPDVYYSISMEHQWTLQPKAPADFFEQHPEVDNIILQLLYNRCITEPEAIETFLKPDYYRDVYDPFLFRAMRKVVDRIWDAIDNGENILLYGDYDADGVCSTGIMAHFLYQHGIKDRVSVILPHRSTEGYGLSSKTVPKVLAAKPDLVITLDCGSTNVAEIKEIQDSGADVIVVDHHHEPEEVPRAFAILNCAFTNETYPTKNLAAGGMAFKVVQALTMHAQETRESWDQPDGSEKWYLDLAAIATVADMVPLIGENRTLVSYGLKVLNKTRRLGLRELITRAGVELGKLTERHIGFVIGPRINSAGRIRHSMDALDLVLTDDLVDAAEKADGLQSDNSERQAMTQDYYKQAKEQVLPQVEKEEKILFAYNPDWNIGLIGLVAGRLLEEYKRPIVVMAEVEGVLKASGRSIKSFHITEALEDNSDLFSQFGGHAQACGFTAAEGVTIDQIKERLRTRAIELVTEEDLVPELKIDVELPLSHISWDLYFVLEQFAPFGQEAPKPVFASKGVMVQAVEPVGTSNQHARIVVTDDKGVSRKTIGFGFGDWKDKLSYGDFIDIVYDVDVNEWNGSRELQLKLISIKSSEQKA